MTITVSALGACRVVPVVVMDSLEAAWPLADALAAGGLGCVEVTLRTSVALDALRALSGRNDLLVGAGSVRSAQQAEEAVGAGARFIVSPGFSDAVVERCRELDVAVLPGVATPTEIMRALDAGLEVVKLFPAVLLGGAGGVRALAAPFPSVRFVPTGGVGRADLAEYLSLPAVLAVGGSWMVAPDLLRAGRFDEVRRLAREAVTLATAVRP
jgi:2-dehydro-3-deoxyphosphogluconate aldolase / (4S)-4-hydroxy-2-oxoglutarate aldolase